MRTILPPATPAEEHTTGDWRHRAACRDEDPELFFPVGGGGAASQTAAYIAAVAEAKAVCRRCPVAASCLSWAMANGVDHGVFGGLDHDERRALRTRRGAA